MKELTHHCIIPDGIMAGNTHIIEIKPEDIEYQTLCEVCGEVLIADHELLANLYEFILGTQ